MDKNTLSIFLEGELHPELVQVDYRDESDSPIRSSIRGKSSVHNKYSYFQWTLAVKGMCILLLKTLFQHLEGIDNLIIIEGEGSSAASALDYAISRQSDWIVGMFGKSSDKEISAKKIFIRTNSERKRPGPVTIQLNTKIICPYSIRVVHNNTQLNSSKEISLLYKKIESGLIKVSRPKANSLTSSAYQAIPNVAKTSNSFDIDNFKLKFRSTLIHEISTMLFQADIFNMQNYKSALQIVANNPSIKKVAGRAYLPVDSLDLELPLFARFGKVSNEKFIKNKLCTGDAIKFAMTPSQSSCLAIALYLKLVKGYNVEINYNYTHTYEILKGMKDPGSHDINSCILSIATASLLAKDHRRFNYRPLMILPAASHNIVTSRHTKNIQLDKGIYCLLSEFLTTPQLFFEELERKNILDKKRLGVVNATPDETQLFLKDDTANTKAILWFPYNVINKIYNNCIYVRAPRDELASMENILYLREDVFKDKEKAMYLDIAIRDAWLELRSNVDILENIVNVILSDKGYIDCLLAYSGLKQTLQLAAG